MPDETSECDWSEPDYKPIRPEPPLLWQFLTGQAMRELTLSLCGLALLWIFLDSGLSLGVKDAHKAPAANLYLGEGDNNGPKTIEVSIIFQRTFGRGRNRDYHLAKVAVSNVNYEVDPSIDGLTVTVVPTFWSRLFDPNTLLAIKSITIHVPTTAEALLLQEFLAQEEDTSFNSFKRGKRAT